MTTQPAAMTIMLSDAVGNDAASLGQTCRYQQLHRCWHTAHIPISRHNAPGSKILTYDEALSATTAAASTFIVQTTGANNHTT